MTSTPAPVFTVVGKPLPRVEGADKVTGRSRYTADHEPPGTLWAKNVRSPFPHARIVSIDTSRAKLVPGVRAIITAADIPDLLTGHQGQIDGSVIQGVGYALMEELILDDGRITTTNFNDYKMPTILDVPELITVNVPDPGTGPFGAKSIGEIPHIPTAGAITNAVADAIGAPMFELPVTAERVLAAIRSRG